MSGERTSERTAERTDERTTERAGGERDAQPVEVQVHIEATPDEVFDYVTDRARFPGREGTVHLGRVTDADPPWRVVYEAEVDEDGEQSHPGSVEVTLTPDADGTLVRVVHGGLPPASLASRTPVALAA